jgi:hypothetical protein
MFDVVSCPKCSGKVTLPDGAPQHGWVRCPICRGEYQAHDLLNFHPPELELIDAPAKPAERRVPNRDAAAVAAAPTGTAATASQIAAHKQDSVMLETTEELAVAPVGAATTVIPSSDVDDDSNVFTFDDSLLLDEPTDELPRLPSSDVAASTEHQDDLLPAWQSDASGPIEWQSAGALAPPPVEAAGESEADELRATQGRKSAVTIFDREGAPPVTDIPTIGVATRRKPRRRSPLFLIVSVVGGGFLGLAAGYGILMWLFDPPRDPLRLAPRLPGFLVPEALRSNGVEPVAQSSRSDEPSSSIGKAPTNDDQPSKSNASGDGFLPPFEAGGNAGAEPLSANVDPFVDPKVNPLEPGTRPPENSQTDKKSDSLTELFGNPENTQTKTEVTDPLKNPFDAALGNEAPANQSNQPSTAKSADSKADPPEKRIEELGPVTEKRSTREQLLAAIASARLTTQRAMALSVNAAAAEKKKVNGPFYMNLCKIAESLTFLDRSADEQREGRATTAAIEAILDAVPDHTRLEELGKLAGYWYERPQGNGIVLSGFVKQSNPRGNFVESVVETMGPPRPITIVSPSALIDDPSRPVLIVGTIVKDAGKNLRGYDGPAETVVWAAQAIDPTAPSRAGSAP